jgi:protein-tyrosine phosphatase
VLRVLVVCTGNVCRSPAVERLLGTWLGPAGLVVSSAGIGAMAGAPMTEQMAKLVANAGGQPDGFVSRQLTEDMVAEADLVLTATREHRGEIVALHPPALRKTFTLREFVRLAGTVNPVVLPAAPAVARFEALIPLALDARTTHHAPRAEDDIDDPYGRDDAAYRRAFGQILPAVHGLLDLAVG